LSATHSTPSVAPRQDLRALLWCAAAFLAAVLLHLGHVPFWTTATAALCAGWSVAIATRRLRAPGRIVKGALAFLLVAAVIAMFHTLNGLAAGTTLLAGMGSFKLLEAQSRRDRYIVIGTALFLLLAACLSQQGLVYAPLYAAHAGLCCSALAIVTHPQSTLGNRAAVVLTARSLLFALPLAVLGFLLFPRLAGSFWALPASSAGVTGLSDTMSPGGISNLSESTDPAFRVWFDGALPPPAQRYWRGPVLHAFDGYTWSLCEAHLPDRPCPEAFASSVEGQTVPLAGRYEYRITLEPTSQHWWFALDTVDASPGRSVRLTPDHVLVAARSVTEPVTYQAVSHTSVRVSGPLPPAVRERELRPGPSLRNPRAFALARRLRAQAPSDAVFIEAVLGFFRRGGFQYTLTPPQLGADSVDEFLFGTRRGFCGHYASAFVMLMRAGGVPARVVTGYLGGEWNTIGHYLLVRQSDAHAWAEVWLEGRGWTRIDPTAVVAPERLTRGILDFLPNAASMPERWMLHVPWLASIRQTWDAANAWWTNRVIGFNLNSQLSLLHRLGFSAPRPSQLVWLLACGIAGWLAVATWQLGLPRSARPDRLARAYNRLCSKLARVGAPRAPHLGPMAYAEAIARRRPDLVQSAGPLLAAYAELRYGALSGELADNGRASPLTAFERGVARLRVAHATRAPASPER
jgi:protein-glutamine gamma-glutamyltransferase